MHHSMFFESSISSFGLIEVFFLHARGDHRYDTEVMDELVIESSQLIKASNFINMV